MWNVLIARLCQKYRTAAYPCREPALPERFRGRPLLNADRVPDPAALAAVCPNGALGVDADRRLRLDMGLCLFCGACATACPEGVTFSRDHRLAAHRREDLTIDSHTTKLADALDRQAHRLFGRSLRLRQVSAGGCGACEADTNVLNTLTFDLSRFGIQFVAAPRHADGLLITGPVTRNMEQALRKTYEAVPAPKRVIAVGACAISGGPYVGHAETLGGADAILPVDLYIPGCPPHPYTILDGLLRLLGRSNPS